MAQILLVHIQCDSFQTAKKISRRLTTLHLGILLELSSSEPLYDASDVRDKLGRSEGMIVLKTVSHKYSLIEKEIAALSTAIPPLIYSVPLKKAPKKYHEWIMRVVKAD